jgi:hypothetical protein
LAPLTSRVPDILATAWPVPRPPLSGRPRSQTPQPSSCPLVPFQRDGCLPPVARPVTLERMAVPVDSTMAVATVGPDTAKHVVQVHCADAHGRPLIQKRLRRAQVQAIFEAFPLCLVGMEVCASAHHWARELSRLGHGVKLVPPRHAVPSLERTRMIPRMRRRSAKPSPWKLATCE